MFQVAVLGGRIAVVEVPAPAVRSGGVLVRTSHSLISAGTESAGVGGGGGNNLALKALRNPRLVRKVMDAIASRGLRETVDLVHTRLATAQPAGYASAGVVVAVGEGVEGVSVGERVACCGTGYANHAGVNFVPRNLFARLPDQVSLPEGAFATLGAIALQGVRRCGPTLGERIVVIGLGLLGQLTAQLLRLAGAEVIGVDVRPERVERAKALGMAHGLSAERDLAAGVMDLTEGIGADGVIVTAAGNNAAVLNQCFEACRRKGRVVLVGDVPIRILRERMYKKELDFLISTSYGPGRYDPGYEEHGRDYPLPYVRWTEGRNLKEIVRLLANGALEVKPLIDRTFPIERAEQAYAALGDAARPIGVLLDYHLEQESRRPLVHGYSSHRTFKPPVGEGPIIVGVIGYGDYFRAVLRPLLRAHRGFRLKSVCARSGLTVRQAVEKDGFESGTSDYRELLADESIRVVYIATRHDQHFPIARDALLAGKAVFVEKPMALKAAEAEQLMSLVAEKQALLTVGFNRRFSPHARALKQALGAFPGPKHMLYRVNAGAVPGEHWSRDPLEGGGRIIGEGVHFFDFLRFVCGARPVRVVATALAGEARDEATVTIGFDDGSVGTVLYTGQGAAALGKERVEVFCGGACFVLEDYRQLQVFGAKAPALKTRHVEKGQKEQLENFHQVLKGRGELEVTVADGYYATWCAEQAVAHG